VDDKFSKRKIKCPKCGARVLHVKDSEVQLLTPGSPPPNWPRPPSPPRWRRLPRSATRRPSRPPSSPTPVGEFVKQSEDKQNTMIIVGLVGLFTVVLSGIGLIMSIPLLAVTPFGIALTAAAVWLLVRRKQLQEKQAKLEAKSASSSAGTATEPIPK
jgi:hypothetical protein